VTKVLKESETDQWKAVPRRYPPPSPTPNRMASGIAMRLLMIAPTAMHAIRLSVPSSRKPTVDLSGLLKRTAAQPAIPVAWKP
jgi:hypothetical protein